MKTSTDHDAQVRAHQKLLSAVVGLAVRDAQLRPIKPENSLRRVPTDLALSALDFLFTDSSDGYLVLLDMNPDQFRKRLVDQMFKIEKKEKDKEDSAYKARRNFRYNYLWYYKQQKFLNRKSFYSDDNNEMEAIEEEIECDIRGDNK